MQRFGRLCSALALAIGVLTSATLGSAAQDARPGAGQMQLPEGCEVVADDLVNPRYVAIADDGTLYVTEAGNGGAEQLSPPEEDVEEVVGSPVVEAIEEATPAEGEEGPPLGSRGYTGQVTAVTPDGAQTVLADGLPSYEEGVGPTGIALGAGVIWVANGGAAVALGADPLENENSVVSIDVTTGEVALVAELGSFEEANNSDGTDVNPNLYGMGLGADGLLYVADAGGNTVYQVDPTTGEFALLGIVPSPVAPGGEAPDAEASPAAEEALQPVPTGLDVGIDGNVYVITLGALAPEASSVLIAQADGTFVEAATGLTTGIGVTVGPDGALYASQLTAGFAGEQPEPGNVVRIGTDGTAEPVLEDLPFPHGITFDADGNLYVVVNSTSFGPPLGPGQVWRCEGVVDAVGQTASASLTAAEAVRPGA